MIEAIIGGAVLGLIPAFIAKNKGRNFWLWYFYGFMLFIVALIHSLIIKDESGVQCPACKEWVKEDAVICKHCHINIPEYYKKLQAENSNNAKD